MLRRFLRSAHYAGLLVQIGGPKAFLTQLGRQLYSRCIFFGLEKDLDTNNLRISSLVPYSWQKASDKDIDELLATAKVESKESAHELLKRKWFFECGFHDCYVARTADTGELCFIGWLLSDKDDDLISSGFKGRLPRLKKEEVLLENHYTLERYRGKNIFPSAVVKMCRLAKDTGHKRMIAYVRKDNTACLKALNRLNFGKFGEISELKLLFFTTKGQG